MVFHSLLPSRSCSKNSTSELTKEKNLESDLIRIHDWDRPKGRVFCLCFLFPERERESLYFMSECVKETSLVFFLSGRNSEANSEV